MANNVVHFAVPADDVERARRFYERVFGWRFEAWGPPEFYRVTTGTSEDPGIAGALERRPEPLTGTGLRGGYTCTIAVEDVDATARAVREAGGAVVLEPMEIPTVGWIIQFVDTEGNLVSAMRYHDGHA